MFSLRVSAQRTGRPVFVLAPGLRPADRTAGLPGGAGDRDHLPVHADLGPEAAADVGRDHPDGPGL
jgi:hypothetical protein